MDCVALVAQLGHLLTTRISGRTQRPRQCDECAFHSAGSSGDLPDLHGAHRPSTLSLLLDTVVGWRQLELISARSCALTLWILGTDAHATYAGAEAAPVARCGL